MLLMEIRLPLLLFAACRNYAEPQRQEPKRVSCIIPPASLHRRAAHLVQTPPLQTEIQSQLLLARALALAMYLPCIRKPCGLSPQPWGCLPGAHPCLFPRFTIQ